MKGEIGWNCVEVVTRIVLAEKSAQSTLTSVLFRHPTVTPAASTVIPADVAARATAV